MLEVSYKYEMQAAVAPANSIRAVRENLVGLLEKIYRGTRENLVGLLERIYRGTRENLVERIEIIYWDYKRNSRTTGREILIEKRLGKG